MEVRFLGAAQTVTGSMHLVTTARARVLLDCGLFQGRRREAFERNRELPFEPADLDAVVLSHAHIDHSGALPILPREGFRGTVYTTPATRDLMAAMLEDAALIQVSDARHVNKLIDQGQLHGDHVDPLYTTEDVAAILGKTVGIPYHRPMHVAPGITVTFFDAGHVLGSAIVVLDVEEHGKTTRLLFSGDLGRKNMPILRDPEVPDGAHVLLLESTYGNRIHPPRAEVDDALGDTIAKTFARGGKLIVPTFALERAQEIVLTLKSLAKRGRLPDVPIFVDSPLTVKITDVFRMHPECYDSDVRAMFDRGESPFDLPRLRYISSVEDSKAITGDEAPAIILAASGMCESGRVLHHLRGAIDDPRSTVAIVGFQAPHTLGRRLVERRNRVRIFGVEHERRCEVVVLNGFSAHAGQDELVAFATAVRDRGALTDVALVHGEPPAQRVLAKLLGEHGMSGVRIPEQGDHIRVARGA